MKSRTVVLLSLLLVAVLIAGIAITHSRAAMQSQTDAAGSTGSMGGGGGMMRGPGMMGGHPGMGMGMGQMNCPMMGMMGRATMTASGDYLYVLTGNTLQRYNRDLRLINEVEVKPNPAHMQRMMQNCPMMQTPAPGMAMPDGGRMAPPAPAMPR